MDAEDCLRRRLGWLFVICVLIMCARARSGTVEGRAVWCVQAVQAVVCVQPTHTSRVNLFFESSQRGSMSVSWRVSQERAALPRHSSRRRDPSPPHHVV